jgi:MFS transporter, AAHS family, 4-hydroxybenzoate transporter
MAAKPRAKHKNVQGAEDMNAKEVDLNALMAQRPLSRLQLRICLLCALIAVLDGIDTQAIVIAAPSLAQSFGMKVIAFGPVFSIALLGGVAGAMLCGSLSDAFGRKRVLVAATCVFALFTFMTAFAESYESLLAIRFLAGLGLGGAVPCFLALSSEYTPPYRRGAVASLLWAGFPLGGMVGGFMNAFIVSHFGWPAIFYVGGVLPLIVAGALMIALPESAAYLAMRDSQSDRLRVIAERIAGKTFERGTRFFTMEPKTPGAPVVLLLTQDRTIATLILWLSFFASFGLLGLVVLWTPAILQGVGLAASGTATVLGFHGLGALLGMGAAGSIVHKLGARLALLPAFVVAAACTWLLGNVSSLLEASIVMALIGVFLGLGASGLIALASQVYPTAMRSTGLGWAMGMGRLGQVVGPLVTGRLMLGGATAGAVMELLAILPILVGLALLGLRVRTGEEPGKISVGKVSLPPLASSRPTGA